MLVDDVVCNMFEWLQDCSRNPEVLWAQRSDKLYLTVALPDAKDISVKCEPHGVFTFSAKGLHGASFDFTLELFGSIVPQFDGHYDHWGELMENLLRAKGLWGLVEEGYTEPTEGIKVIATQKRNLEEFKMKDHQVKHYLFEAIDQVVFEQILNRKTSKNI
ncbi:hypothetical protein SDJN02_09623, partial [Cucurbita argyrosperma subsp. argyrosperma]